MCVERGPFLGLLLQGKRHRIFAGHTSSQSERALFFFLFFFVTSCERLTGKTLVARVVHEQAYCCPVTVVIFLSDGAPSL